MSTNEQTINCQSVVFRIGHCKKKISSVVLSRHYMKYFMHFKIYFVSHCINIKKLTATQRCKGREKNGKKLCVKCYREFILWGEREAE